MLGQRGLPTRGWGGLGAGMWVEEIETSLGVGLKERLVVPREMRMGVKVGVGMRELGIRVGLG